MVSRLIDDETILVPIKQKAGEMQCIYTLNETGAYIWQMIDGKMTVGDIVGRMIEKYEVSEEQAFSDLKELIVDLIKGGCIEEI
jgi:hypothetical protein